MDIYVNINNSYLYSTERNGTKEYPFNAYDCYMLLNGYVVNGIKLNESGQDILRLNGICSGTPAIYLFSYINVDGDVIITSWENREPWIVNSRFSDRCYGGLVIRTYKSNKNVYFYDGVFRNISTFDQQYSDVVNHNFYFCNCLIQGFWILKSFLAGSQHNFHFNCCSFINYDDVNYGKQDIVVSKGYNNFINFNFRFCFFQDVSFEGSLNSINFYKRNYFNTTLDETFNLLSGTKYFEDSVFTFNYKKTYPDVNNFDLLNVNYSDYGIDVYLDNYYNNSDYIKYGWLNYLRNGIGAFVFSVNEIIYDNTKKDYIILYGPLTIRYGKNKLINLTNFLPQYIQQTDTKQFLYVFETYLNEMFQGESGFILSATELDINKIFVSASGTSGGVDNVELYASDRNFNYDYGTSSLSAVPTNANNEVEKITINLPDNYEYTTSAQRISVLEKIKRLTELQDPDLIPLNIISLLANNLGYCVDVSREDLAYTGILGNLAIYEDNLMSAVDVGKYLRFIIANLPNWYKIKTTENAVKVLLYSYGLIGEIKQYYTKDYNLYWSFYDDNEFMKDYYYPSPHFAVQIEIEKSYEQISFDEKIRKNVINAINSIRPINTVFDQLSGHFEIDSSIDININIKIDAHFVIT